MYWYGAIPQDIGTLGAFEPVEILLEYDGPRTFTLRDAAGELFLAHWLNEDGEASWFAVVAATERLIEWLKQGELSLLDALDQPRAFIVDVAHSGSVRTVWLTTFAGLPSDMLPLPGTMLTRPRPTSPNTPMNGAVRRPGVSSASSLEASIE